MIFFLYLCVGCSYFLLVFVDVECIFVHIPVKSESEDKFKKKKSSCLVSDFNFFKNLPIDYLNSKNLQFRN